MGSRTEAGRRGLTYKPYMTMTPHDTKAQFEQVLQQCRNLFAGKLHDYGAA